MNFGVPLVNCSSERGVQFTAETGWLQGNLGFQCSLPLQEKHAPHNHVTLSASMKDMHVQCQICAQDGGTNSLSPV